MTIKSILVLFSGGDDEVAALDAAFVMANSFKAGVKIVHVAPDPREVMAMAYAGLGVPPPTIGSLMEEIEKGNLKNKEAAHEKYNKAVSKHSIKFSGNETSPDNAYASFHYQVGNAEDIIASKGRVADIIVIGRAIKNASSHYASAVLSALFNSGRPVLFVPPAGSKTYGSNIMIGWNGSAESARAVCYSMPLLQRAKKVMVLSEDNEYADNGPSADDLVLYLRQHDVEANIVASNSDDLSTGAAIMRDAKKRNVDLLIMGAFSHSRFREMLLGGVTTFMLDHAEIPVLMVH